MPSVQQVRTVPAHDELHHQGESLVLLDGQVRRISPIGTVIRASAVHGATVEELASILEDRFGAPENGDVRELTRSAVHTMLDEGLLEERRPPTAPVPPTRNDPTPPVARPSGP